MFDFVRNHQRLIQLLMMVLIVPSFVFGGIEAWSRFKDSPQDLVTVGGRAVTQPELDFSVREQIERMRTALGSQFDQKMVDTPQLHQQVLDGLVEKRVLLNEVAKENLYVSNTGLQSAIMALPEVAALRKPDGSFDLEAYKQLLKAQGMTVEQFEASVRSNMALQALPAAVFQSSMSPNSVAERLSNIRAQEREVQELTFKAGDYAGKVNPTVEQLKAYYTAHPKEFEVPEQAKVEYVVLSGEAVTAGVQITEKDLQEAYDKNIARFKTEEQRRASHILIAAPKEASATDRAAARVKAEKLATEVRKNPNSFADLAKKNSQDPGSAEKGGDLGFFGKGAMVKGFETAVFSMKAGQISDVVESDFGYHIIQLTAIKAAETKPLAAVKAELEPEVKRQLANRKFSEMSETFSNTVYEQADSLRPVSEKLKLPVQVADAVTRKGVPSLGEGFPLNNEKVLKELFGVDALKSKRNTTAVPVNGNTLVAARVLEYRPATQRSFDDVQAQLKTQVVAEQAAALAKKEADDKLAALKKADNNAGFAPSKWVSRAAPQGLAGAALIAVMKADASKLPSFVQVDLGAAGQAIYRVSKVQQPQTVDTARRQAEAQELARIAAQREYMAFYDALKARAKVKVLRAPAAAKSEEDEGKAAKDKKTS